VLRSERKSLRRFLFLYSLLMLGLFALGSTLYYRNQEQLMLLETKSRMMEYATEQIHRLKRLHEHFPRENLYPRDDRFRSAIYDLEHVRIFSTLRNPHVDFLGDIYTVGDMIHYVKILDLYYLGAKYLFIEVPRDHTWMQGVWRRIVLAGAVLALVLTLLGYYLARLFVRPMRQSIRLLDDFIHDTTHELNTPLASILANIEMIDAASMPEGDRRRLERIGVAARTVSTLYEDLKFVTLERHRPTQDEDLEFDRLLQERLDYFDLLLRSKNLKLDAKIRPVRIRADRRLLARVIDNLLSNAVKYNRRGGMLRVILEPGELRIADTGVGMEAEELEQIFERYRRFNDTEGGFGLGLDIVKRIADRYGWQIVLHSQKGEGTEVILRWEADRE
jgi:two-component system OmpR family sensor kinase